jgi:hypothetical protein
MGYYLVDKMPIFLTREREKELRDEVSKDKTPWWQIGSRIAYRNNDNSPNKELERLMFDLIIKKYNSDKQKFISEWYTFDLLGDVASLNAWDLLYDFSTYYGYSFLKDFRDFSEKLEADYSGELFSYPMGKVFSFNHFVKPAKWWWKYRYKMKGRTVELIIDVNKITKINGNLTDFYIHFNDTSIRFNKNIQVYFNKMLC